MDANATVRRLECREWIDKDYRGIYQFAFDDQTDSLVASYKPEEVKYPLLGQSVQTWKLLWKKDLNAVFYDVTENWWAPVKVLSLHFGKAQMFLYDMGSDMEGDLLVTKIIRECVRPRDRA